MSENLKLWDRVYVTDPAHVKPITGKDYGGNSPKPYWIVQRLTQEFGPCGIGWGYSIDSERFERFSDTDALHIAKVTLWYEYEGKRGQVTQMGQTKASYVTSKGAFKVDEDAPKKSVTDALVKCASYLGFAGDIFSGMWDDSKYVEWAGKEWRNKERAEEEKKPPSGSAREHLKDVFESLQPEIQTSLRKTAEHMAAKEPGEALAVFDLAADQWDVDKADLKKAVWYLLDSKTRSAIKAHEAAQ